MNIHILPINFQDLIVGEYISVLLVTDISGEEFGK